MSGWCGSFFFLSRRRDTRFKCVWSSDVCSSDLGKSLTTGQSVTADIAARLPASAELTLIGLVIATSIAVPLGALAAVRQGSLIDHACRIITTPGVSLPVFFTGLLLAYVFSYHLGWAAEPPGRL